MQVNLDNFDEEACVTLQFAEKEARRVGNGRVRTENLLVALLRQEGSLPEKVLTEAGVQLRQVRKRLGKLDRNGQTAPGEIRPSPAVWKSIQYAGQEAERFGGKISPAYLLLGLIINDRGLGVSLIAGFDVSLEKLSVEIERQLGPRVLT